MRLVCGRPCLVIFRHLNTGRHFWLNLYLLLGILRAVNLQQYYCCIWSILCVVDDWLTYLKIERHPFPVVVLVLVVAGKVKCCCLQRQVKHLSTHFSGSYECKAHCGSQSRGWTVIVEVVVHTGIPSHSRKKKTKDQVRRWFQGYLSACTAEKMGSSPFLCFSAVWGCFICCWSYCIWPTHFSRSEEVTLH